MLYNTLTTKYFQDLAEGLPILKPVETMTTTGIDLLIVIISVVITIIIITAII